MPSDCPSTGRIDCPAKLNLFLHITGKDARGYHLLDSLAVQTAFGDQLTVAPAPEGGATDLRLTGRPVQGAQSENILLTTLNAYNTRFGSKHRLRLSLEKAIPVAAGLGGGSADAAGLLRWLCTRDGRDLNDRAVQDLALTIGADLPVCLQPHPQLMRGVGEQLSRVTLPPLAIVLVNPNVALSTAAVFAARQADFTPLLSLPPAIDVEWLAAQRNDLQPPAMRLQPVIGDVLGALIATNPAFARMSGSGATCFAVYNSLDQANSVAEHLTSTHPGWFVGATISFAGGMTL